LSPVGGEESSTGRGRGVGGQRELCERARASEGLEQREILIDHVRADGGGDTRWLVNSVLLDSRQCAGREAECGRRPRSPR
jgi:hypothetical protein